MGLNNQRPDLNLIPADRKYKKIIILMKRCWSQNKSDRSMFPSIKGELEDQQNTIDDTATCSKSILSGHCVLMNKLNNVCFLSRLTNGSRVIFII